MANSDELIREAVRNGEAMLQMQMSVAIAADQRAVSLGGILAAAASVVLGFLFTGTEVTGGWTLYLCVFMSGGLVLASGLAFFAARPVEMWSMGNRPSNWYHDIETDKPASEAFREMMAYLDEMIFDNIGIMQRNAKFLTAAMATAAGTIFLRRLPLFRSHSSASRLWRAAN